MDGLGYDCTRMNEGGNSTYKPLICEKDVSCFHVNVQERSHHELNGVLWKGDYLIQKQWATLKENAGSKNGCWVFGWCFRFFGNMFMFCVCNVFQSMKEESMIQKLHQIAREEKSLRIIEKKRL